MSKSNLSERIALLEQRAARLPDLVAEQVAIAARFEELVFELKESEEAASTLSRLEAALHTSPETATLSNPDSTATTPDPASIEQTPLAVAEQEPTPEQATPDAPASPAPAGFENLTNPEAILAFLDQHPGTYFSNAEITDGLVGWGRTMGSVSTYMSQLHSKRKVIRRYRDTDDILEYSQLVPEAGPELQEVATLTGVYAAIMKAVHQRPNETASNNLSRVKAHYPALTLEDIKIKLSELERSGWVDVDQTGSLARYTASQQYIDRGRA